MKHLAISILLLTSVVTKGADAFVFDTISDLLSWPGSGVHPNFEVKGYTEVGDWGSTRAGKYITNSVAVTNLGCVFMPTNGVGRFVFEDCEGGEVYATWFGATGDGATDDTAALQAAIDWAGEQLIVNPSAAYTNAFGATIRFPDNKRFLHSGLQLKRGVRLIGKSPADKPYPADDSMPRLLLKGGATRPSFWAGIYTNHLGNWESAGRVTLQGLIIDGQFDLQDTNNFSLHGLRIFGGSTGYSKGWIIEGCAFVDHVGYSIFCLAGLGASSVRNCYLGNGIFTAVVADFKLQQCDVTGRTRGLQSKTLLNSQPFPAIWASDYTVKNIFSDLMVYCGPTNAPGQPNSLRSWAVTAYDAGTDIVTLATTNGLHDGLPLVWRSASMPGGISSNLTYYVTFQGSNTVKVSSIGGYISDPRNYTDITSNSPSGDVLQFGESAAVYVNGGSSSSYNLWSNIRVEDGDDKLVLLDGAYANQFVNLGLGSSYSGGNFLHIRGDAFANTFIGGYATYLSPNIVGTQPSVIVRIENRSRANRSVGFVINNGLTNLLDENRTFPANQFDYQQPSQINQAGNTFVQRFEDFDAGTTNINDSSRTNFFVQDSANWYWKRHNVTDIATTADMAFIGSLPRLELHSDGGTPQYYLAGYGAAPRPRLDFVSVSGTRATNTVSTVGGGGSIFFAGHDGTNITAAKASILAVWPYGWGTTNGSSAELAFETTPYGSYSRSEKLRILGYGGLQIAEQSTPPLTPATNTFALYSPDAGGRLAVKWDTGVTNVFVGTINYPTADGAYILFVTNGVASWIAHP